MEKVTRSDPFNSHTWSMMKAGTNRHGESVYIAACTKCLQTTAEIRKSNLTCEEVQDD